MGETIRYMMVAAVAVGSIVGLPSTRTASAQGTNGQGSGAMELPKSLSSSLSNSISSAFGKTADTRSTQAQNAANSASDSFQSGSYGSGSVPGRTSARPGGPTTDPNAPRDNSWMNGNTPPPGARPSTDPWAVNNQSRSSAPSNGLSDKLRKSLPNARSSNGGSQQPTGAANSGRVNPSTNSTGFASLPGGINLPEKNPQGNTGSGFGQNGFTGSQNGQGGTPFGANSTARSNFDPSMFNTNRNTTPATGRQGQSQQTAQNQLGFPGNASGKTLGIPATDPAGAGNGVPTNWTADQIIALGAKFSLPSNDPRLNNRAFVNDLYARWQDYEAKQRAAAQSVAEAKSASGTTFGSPFGSGTAADSWGRNVPGAANRSNIEMAQFETQRQLSQNGSPSDLGRSDPNYLGRSNPPIPSRSAAASASRRKPLYDSFGNRVDVEGNILDEFGNPVDAATEYELTVGKKLREEMDRITKEREELERRKREQVQGSPSDRVATLPPSSLGLPSGTADQFAMNDVGFGERGIAPRLRTQVQRPPSSEEDLRSENDQDRLSADQAGIGGAAKAIGRSNPYINVFLLSSLVANVFLFLWLHRLWNHHRELIAASRMAASGISTSE